MEALAGKQTLHVLLSGPSTAQFLCCAGGLVTGGAIIVMVAMVALFVACIGEANGQRLSRHMQEASSSPASTTTSEALSQMAPSPLPSPAEASCHALQVQYNILPGYSSGSAPESVLSLWVSENCDAVICVTWRQMYGVVPFKTWGSLPSSLHRSWDWPRPKNGNKNCNALSIGECWWHDTIE